ncbi:MAG: dihydropteroate synthase [Bacteroidetes bacterium]|nr:dihydropteroate synthase [Bacteroidota bacterium]
MGILNCTPDSFFDGGVRISIDAQLQHCETMISEGAAIIDIGAFSTRPGYSEISEDEELQRLLPVVREIRRKFPTTTLSIDTFRSAVVRRVFGEIGEFIVNDISGGLYDNEMLKTCGELSLPYICMHLQDVTQSKTMIADMQQFFETQIAEAHKYGIQHIIIDPGFGFGKTIEQQYELLNCLDEFMYFNLPLLVGVSRKSMIWKTLQCTPQEALNGTTILNTIALTKGAHILRVHDVKEAVECVQICQCFNVPI